MTTLVLQGTWRPTAVLAALESIANSAIDELRLAVAYATFGGCDMLLSRLEALIGESRWSAIPKAAIVTLDFHLTEPAALDYMRSQGFVVRLSSVPQSNFHPKLYAFISKNQVDALVGSANLTQAALTDNVEAGVVTRMRRRAFDATWEEMVANSAQLTNELLADYKHKRRSKPPAAPLDRTVGPTPTASATRLVGFPDAIASGALKPGEFQALWVQCDKAQGGSENQLELPRGAYMFFNLKSGGAGHLIGRPLLFSGGRQWADRPLTWHGQGRMNQMERLNLPTVMQGGCSYRNSIVLFRRQGSRYQLTVAPQGSAMARAWRRASRAAGTEYRLGRSSPRLCGLF